MMMVVARAEWLLLSACARCAHLPLIQALIFLHITCAQHLFILYTYMYIVCMYVYMKGARVVVENMSTHALWCASAHGRIKKTARLAAAAVRRRRRRRQQPISNINIVSRKCIHSHGTNK